jgi:malate dehydrogenase (oxaloacetate-decarboxylating)(NADP+)
VNIDPSEETLAEAKVPILPNLSAANVSYELLDQLEGADGIGPILLGMAQPVHILQRGSTAQDAANLVTIASVDAQRRCPQT